jgi:hypothetical protein
MRSPLPCPLVCRLSYTRPWSIALAAVSFVYFEPGKTSPHHLFGSEVNWCLPGSVCVVNSDSSPPLRVLTQVLIHVGILERASLIEQLHHRFYSQPNQTSRSCCFHAPRHAFLHSIQSTAYQLPTYGHLLLLSHAALNPWEIARSLSVFPARFCRILNFPKGITPVRRVSS